MKKITNLLTLLLLVALTPVFAQIKTPQPSPLAKLSQDVGLVKVDIEYSRPSAKGRKVFGELVPFGDMWRTGANASTKVTFSDEAKVGGITIAKGTYALYTVPGENEWSIIFYKNTTFGGTPGKDFNEADVAARFNVPVVRTADYTETFTINLNSLRNNGANLELLWENTKVAIPISVDTDSKVLADIKNIMDGPSAGTYYQAARYYYEEKKDMDQALAWVNESLRKGGDRYWILRLKAQILAEQKRYAEAIEAAQRSTELAKADGDANYVRMNEKSIDEWSKMKGKK